MALCVCAGSMIFFYTYGFYDSFICFCDAGASGWSLTLLLDDTKYNFNIHVYTAKQDISIIEATRTVLQGISKGTEGKKSRHLEFI